MNSWNIHKKLPLLNLRLNCISTADTETQMVNPQVHRQVGRKKSQDQTELELNKWCIEGGALRFESLILPRPPLAQDAT